MGGKKIKVWSQEDKDWLTQRYRADASTGQIFLNEGGAEAPYFRINPARKQYLAVSAKIGGKWTKLRLHHLIWFLVTGEQSLKMIDHKEATQDTVFGNRFSNLRQCTDKQNRANIARKGYRVAKDKEGNVKGYFATMSWKDSVTGKVKYKRSSIVATPEIAEGIYWGWQRQHHKEFAYTGEVAVSSGLNITTTEV